MKKKSIFIFSLIALAMTTFSCSKEMMEKRVDNGKVDEITENQQVTITAYLPEVNPDSRVSIKEAGDYSKAILSWEAGDQITIVSTGTAVTTTLGIGTIDGNKATFTGDAPAGTAPYTIFYHRSKPLNLDKYDSITCDGQVQDGNGSLAHLQYGMKLVNVNEYQSLTFSQAWATAHSGTISQNSVMQMLLKVPEGVGEVYSIYVHDDGTFKQTLWLKDGENLFAAPNAKHVIKAYMMVPDMDLAAGNLTIRVETEDGAYEKAYPLSVTDWAGGSQYTVQKDMSGLSAVDGEHAAMEIHAKCAKDILQFKAGVIADNARFKASNVVLESDIDMTSAGTWSTSIPDTFTGTFEGNNKSFSNLTATQPLFATVNASAHIQNLTLDNTCAFTFTHTPTNTALYCGAIANTLSGTITGITVNATVALAGATATALVDIGGLIGRANTKSALVSDCHFNGLLTVPSTYSTSSEIRVGGIVGCITQKSPVIQVKGGTSFGGVIDCQGASSISTYNTPKVCVGGIVGSNAASVSNCSTSDADESAKVSITISETEYKASIAVHPADKYIATAVGGIVGYNQSTAGSVSSCDNYSTILTYIPNASVNNAFLDAGGIVGHSTTDASVSSCNNYGPATHISTSKTQHIGGAIGFDAGKLGTCYNQNTGELTIKSTPLVLRLGGVIGEKAGGSVTASSTIRNRGSISVTGASASSSAFIGGVVGNNSVALDGVDAGSPLVTNNSSISVTPGVVTSSVWAIGGVVGNSSANLSKVSNNGGSVTVTGKYSSGTSGSGSTKNIYVGGVLGITNDIITVSGCKNAASISYSKDVSTKTNACPSYVGGVIGGMGNEETGAGTISNCTNTGTVSNTNSNNSHGLGSGPMTGGIIGAIVGKSDQRGTISGVSVSYDTNKSGIYALRGDLGGVTGYASYTDIDGTSCNVRITGAPTSADYRAGGAIGIMINSSLSNFAFSGTIVGGIGYMGGLVDNMDASSSIDDCTVNADITGGQVGSVVHTSATGATITGCGVYGTINSTGITTADSVTDYSNKATIAGTYLLTP